MAEHDAYFVQSLDRGLAVIRAFGEHAREQTLSDVARATGLSRAAARRFLLTLVDLGYVRTDGRLFALTPRVLDLGYAFLSGLSLPEIAQPHLERLSREVDESASISLLNGPDIVYLARVPVSRIMTVAISVGTRFPAYATSMGRVLLAGLGPAGLTDYLREVELRGFTRYTITDRERLREEIGRVCAQGYALVEQELEEGLRAIAVPVRDSTGRVIAAMNVSAHAGRTDASTMCRDILPVLRKAAEAVATDLASVRPVT